jgi:hypothetical protein
MPLDRHRQLGLFEPRGPTRMTSTQRSKVIGLLRALLLEVLMGSAETAGEARQAIRREAGDDEDHA